MFVLEPHFESWVELLGYFERSVWSKIGFTHGTSYHKAWFQLCKTQLCVSIIVWQLRKFVFVVSFFLFFFPKKITIFLKCLSWENLDNFTDRLSYSSFNQLAQSLIWTFYPIWESWSCVVFWSLQHMSNGNVPVKEGFLFGSHSKNYARCFAKSPWGSMERCPSQFHNERKLSLCMSIRLIHACNMFMITLFHSEASFNITLLKLCCKMRQFETWAFMNSKFKLNHAYVSSTSNLP